MQQKWYLAAALVALGLTLQGCGEEGCQVDGQIGECKPCDSLEISDATTCEAMCRSDRIKLGCGTPGGSSDCRDQLAEPAFQWDGGGGSCSCIGVGDGDVKEWIRVCMVGEAGPGSRPQQESGGGAAQPVGGATSESVTSESSRMRGGKKEEKD
mmetsp:Transcript_55837/g.122590  ORF Transcript_55837/g.122590 Transcript_55837/m.122590 type:complete len:154 (-) Transcript_55837:9-470(-)